MIFLIEYSRKSGSLVRLRSFALVDRKEAEDERLKLELENRGRNLENEVVLLDAASEEALRRTHRRYFENLNELAAT